MLFPAIPHGDEHGQETAVRRLDGEIALMIAHRRDDSFCRKCKVSLLEGTAECRRILDEIEHLLEKVRRDLRRPPARLRRLRNLLTDHRTAALRIDDNVRSFTGCLIVCR